MKGWALVVLERGASALLSRCSIGEAAKASTGLEDLRGDFCVLPWVEPRGGGNMECFRGFCNPRVAWHRNRKRA